MPTDRTAEPDTEVLQQAIEQMIAVTTNMITILGITNTRNLQRTMETAAPTIPKMIRLFSIVDWENFEPTDSEIQKAQKTLHSEAIEQMISAEISEEQADQKLSNPFKTVLLVLMLLYSTMGFIDDSTTMTVREITHNQIIPACESVRGTDKLNQRITKKQMTKQLSNTLKEKVPTEITPLFMIVNKNQLPVYEGLKSSSKVVGTLDVLEVVQVLEKKRKWSRIVCDSRKKREGLAGWVLTKYLKKIN